MHLRVRLARSLSRHVLIAVVLTAVAVALATLLGDAPSLADRAARTAPTTTHVSVMRPVTHAGEAAAGWTVVRESGSVDCDGAAPSATADGISSCYPTAVGVRACFLSDHHTVLCVRDLAGHRLARIRYTGAYPDVTRPAQPQPLRLTLGDGAVCLQRVGGAWSAPRQHPDWVGYASCSKDGSIYGPGDLGGGIDRSTPVWRVQTWEGRSTISRHSVSSAVLVGYARES